jgi:hypothetical protein
MSPRETLLDRIDKLRELAEEHQPAAAQANELLADIRVYFAAVGATHCPRKPQPGVSAGTLEEARKFYGS